MSQMTHHQAERFAELDGSYMPSVEVCQQLQSEVEFLATLSGPQAVGKSALLAGVRPELEVLRAFTTRPQRPGEQGGYVWRPDTPAEYDAILDDAYAGRLVQVQQGLGGYVYGNYPEDYARRTIIDISASGALAFDRLQLPKVAHLFMVSPPQQYIPRFFSERLPQVGLLRAIESLSSTISTLAQTVSDDRYIFVANVEGQLQDTIGTVKDIAAGNIDANKEAEARQMAIELLTELEEQTMNDYDLHD